MKRVAIESPFAGNVAFNLKYLDLCILDCIRRGETPYASHRMLVTALDDLIPRERDLGIRAGMAMSRSMDLRAFYLDLGMSSGMQQAWTTYSREGFKIEERNLSSTYGDIPTEIHKLLGARTGVEAADAIALRDQEITRLRQWIDDLQSGMYVNCVYCGHRYGPREGTPTSMADVLRKHIEICPDHPISALKIKLEETEKRLAECKSKLK